MKTNKHAALIDQYAQDWKETKEPWTRWEGRMIGASEWMGFLAHPQWVDGWEYRRKPQTRTVTIELPLPLRVKPGRGYTYAWIYDGKVMKSAWSECAYDNELFANGRCFANEADAQAALDAFTAALKGGLSE